MRKFLTILVYAFLLIVAVFGMLAFVMQKALNEPITFAEFFQRYL